ncbi:MAG TPA: DNA polymerase III subunit chi, partial [Thalassospira lucentensis]
MADIWFYHLTSMPLERALPTLLSKTLEREKRAVVMTGIEQRVDAINTLLWTYDAASWLPHGAKSDGDPEMQPVWLTSEDENPNGAQFLFLTDRAISEKIADYERVIMLFDDRDHDAVAEARTRWKDWKDAGHKLS